MNVWGKLNKSIRIINRSKTEKHAVPKNVGSACFFDSAACIWMACSDQKIMPDESLRIFKVYLSNSTDILIEKMTGSEVYVGMDCSIDFRGINEYSGSI